MSYISFNNFNLSYDKNVIFKNITFNIEKNSLTSVTTPSSKGKSTLLNIIMNYNEYSNIKINDKNIKIGFINNNIKFFSKTVYEELYSVNNDIKIIKKYLKEFNLTKILKLPISDLNYVTLQKINLIKILLNGNNIILIDNIFPYFDKYSKIEYIGFLKKYQLENNLTIIYTASNLEDIIFSDNVVIIDKEILYCGNIDKIYCNDKLLKKSKLNIPIENELIEKLKLYDVIDKTTYTIDEVVKEICK